MLGHVGPTKFQTVIISYEHGNLPLRPSRDWCFRCGHCDPALFMTVWLGDPPHPYLGIGHSDCPNRWHLMARHGKCECTIPESVPQSQFQLCRCYQTGSTMLLLVIPRNPEKIGGPKRGCYAVLHFQQLDPNHNEHRLIMYFVIWPAYGLGLFFGSWESSWRLAMFPWLHTMDDLHDVKAMVSYVFLSANPWFF